MSVVRKWRNRAARCWSNIYFAYYRRRKRLLWGLIEWLIPRCGWHNSILDTDLPNVKCLSVVDLVVRNSYGQTREVCKGRV